MDGTHRNLLITRLSHIGDCLLTLPMVNAILDQQPDTKITWAVESPSQQLLSLHPGIQNIIKIPKSWIAKPKNWWSLRTELRRHQFDAVIDPQGITKSALLGWLSGAKTRVGIKGRWGRELSPWLNNCLVETKSTHIVERSIELISGLGLDPQAAKPRFDLQPCVQSRAQMEDWLQLAAQETGLNPERIAILNPGGTWASKRWEMDRFGKVAVYLKQKHDVTSVVVWAGEDEKAMAEAIQKAAVEAGGANACVLAPPTTLRQLAAIQAQSMFFIGGDTGPLHLASAVGTPCIGLYGTTRPIDSGAYGDHHIVVQAWYQAGTCRERRNANNDAMRDISVADVTQACDQMMQRLQLSSTRHDAA